MLIDTNVGWCIGRHEGTEAALPIMAIVTEYLNTPKLIYLV
jgi:hypothetical protein